MAFAIITPSFGGDFERCELLVESVRNRGPGCSHYIIVDSHDIPRFRSLSSNDTVIVDSREVLDTKFKKIPGRSGVWLGLNTLPVRGWMTQQIRKLGINKIIGETDFLCCDSDTVFIKPFSKDSFLMGPKLGLLDVSFRDHNVEKWTRKAEQLLGLEDGSVEERGHVGMMILWNHAILHQLHQEIERNCGVSWQTAIARQPTFSEYITYGVFVRSVIGYENSPHAPSSIDLVKTNWGKVLKTSGEFEEYFSTLLDTQIAAMVHSKDGTSVKSYRSVVEKVWKEFSN